MPNFLKYGLLAAVFSTVYTLILQFIGSDLRFNPYITFAFILFFPIIFMMLAVKAERNNQEGLISFGAAFKTSFLTYLIFIIVAMIVGQLVVQMYTPDDWNSMVEFQKRLVSSGFNALGMDQVMIDDELEKITVDSMKEQTSGASIALLGILMYAFLGLITSLIVSLIMKRNPTL